jgi:eukaryotic-like serine/threonine-protein kinase
MDLSRVVAGTYEIESPVGRGGMGSVYRARDLRTRELVAIKVQNGRGEGQSRRWAREAMLLANLAGPARPGEGLQPSGGAQA